MTRTVTTTVRVPADLYEARRKRASDEHRSVADVIREALRHFLDVSEVPPVLPDLDSDSFWSAVGSVEGPSDESVEHDYYLYGSPKRTRR